MFNGVVVRLSVISAANGCVGSGRGLVARVLDSRVVGSIPTLGNLRQFHLPQFASVYSAGNEYQHCWEGTCDRLASCPGESVQLHSNSLR